MSEPFPTHQDGFRVLLSDPPWAFSSNSKAKPGRNAMRHYDTMTVEEIAAMPVKELMAANAVLFLWITGPHFVAGAHFKVMKAWGFKPSGIGFTWIKLNKNAASLFMLKSDLFMGGGFTTRKNAEFCLIGKRGKSVRVGKSVHEVIISPRREHSRKPDETYERIEEYSPGPYIELFARNRRPGWLSWGNQLDRFS